jgi:hypothetical protein
MRLGFNPRTMTMASDSLGQEKTVPEGNNSWDAPKDY